jgi:maleate cis-trans isomerase
VDTIFISCTNLRALSILEELEDDNDWFRTG